MNWKTTEPPHERQPIVAIGRAIYTDEISTVSEPFCLEMFWEKDSSGYEGWHHLRGGLTVARTPDDEIKIDHWIEYPNL